MSRLGKRLINAANSAQAIAKGEADPEAYGFRPTSTCGQFGPNSK
jgi:hypothetical protein